MSTVSGSQYGVGLITLLVAASIGIGYYQMFYLPEQLATPDVDEHVLHPVKSTIIDMILGSANTVLIPSTSRLFTNLTSWFLPTLGCMINCLLFVNCVDHFFCCLIFEYYS